MTISLLPYWLLFAFPALLALGMGSRPIMRTDGTLPVRFDPAILAMLILLIVMIGLRYNVGGDWPNYQRYLVNSIYMDYAAALVHADPAYAVLNVMATELGLGIAFVNTVCATLFALGLVIFCGSFPRPWLGLACAVPYLVIVVAMGYTRQSVAIGLAMIGFAALRRGSFVRFCVLVLAGAAFHRTAIVVIPLIALLRFRNSLVRVLLALCVVAFGYLTLLADSFQNLYENYVVAQYQSAGALVRLTMNLIPSLLFLAYRKRFVISLHERQLYSLLSYLSVGAFLAFFATPASTALDRLALYLIPLQMFVFGRLPNAMSNRPATQSAIAVLIIAYHAAVLFVWLTYADNAYAWRPYRSFLW